MLASALFIAIEPRTLVKYVLLGVGYLVALSLALTATVLTAGFAVAAYTYLYTSITRAFDDPNLLLLVFGLVAVASQLGLDLLLGGFVAGIIVRATLHGREISTFDSKVTAVGYGLLIPFFFVTSGMEFDLDSLVSSGEALAKLPLFAALFLLVRGAPALLLYRRVLDARSRASLAFFSATELPLVVAITTLAVDGGHMRSSTAANAPTDSMT